jgi:hypothetical protein
MPPPGFTRPNLCSYALLPGSQSLRSSGSGFSADSHPTGRRCAPSTPGQRH